MINKSIIKAVLTAVKEEAKNSVINELLNHIHMDYDYKDSRATHVLEMLTDPTTIISIKDINLDYVKNNPNLLLYNFDKYNIKDIKVTGVDNIDTKVKIEFKYLEKDKEDKDDASYMNSSACINFIDNPDILNK